MDKKNYLLLIFGCAIFSSISLASGGKELQRTKNTAGKRSRSDFDENDLLPNKKRKKNSPDNNKTKEIIAALGAYFDNLTLKDNQKASDVDLIIPNLPIPIVVTEKEEDVVDVKL